MSKSFRSAVELRNDMCKTLADLQQRFTRPLPNGATVYVQDTDTLYRLYKDLGTTYDALTALVVIPGDQSANRWVVQDTSNGSSPWYGVELVGAANVLTTGGAGVWQALGSTAGTFSLDAGDATVFSVDPASSLLTYHGVPKLYMARAILTVLTSSAEPVNGAISYNNDVVAGTSAGARSAGEQGTTTPGTSSTILTMQRRVLLNPTNTLRLMLRSGLGDPITVSFGSLALEPIG